jgi:PAS domain S-box-containing protein
MPQYQIPSNHLPVTDAADSGMGRGEQRLKLALDAARLGSWELKLDIMELITSEQCKANHGLPPDAELTMAEGVIGTIDEGYRARFLAAFEEAVKTGGTFEMEVPNWWPDGTHHWLLIRGRVIEPGVMAGVTADITARRATEQALRASEQRFHALADNMAQLAWMADGTGSIFWFNRRWFDYTGETLDAMRGSGWQKVHHPDHAAAVVEKIGRCFASGEPWDDTFPLRSRHGEYRWFLSHAAPIRDEEGRIALWFGTNTDITDQRRAEESLRDADRKKDEFLTVLAHELRGPLSPIVTAAHILQEIGAPDPKLVKQRETILRQARRLSSLVDDLLDVGRIREGKLRLERRRVELNTILQQAAETCAPLIEGRRHALHIHLAPHPIYVHADEGRLIQVVCNLLSNAAKYMQEGGRVDLFAGEEPGAAIVAVSDQGVGIPPEMLSTVFQRYVQVGTSGHRADGGLGIGLSLVKALVEEHGGTVCALSGGIGQGTRFEVRLPTSAEAPAS